MAECNKHNWFKRFVDMFKETRPTKIFEVVVYNIDLGRTFTKYIVAFDKIDAIEKAEIGFGCLSYNYCIQGIGEIKDYG